MPARSLLRASRTVLCEATRAVMKNWLLEEQRMGENEFVEEFKDLVHGKRVETSRQTAVIDKRAGKAISRLVKSWK